MGSIYVLLLHVICLIGYFRKRFTIVYVLSYLVLSISFYVHAQEKLLSRDSEPIPTSLYTWTSTYNINGSKLRGFALSENQEKWYITYTFASENEKTQYLEQSLAGVLFKLTGQPSEIPQPAHDYAFNMNTYLRSHGAAGMLTATSLSKVTEPRGLMAWIAERRFMMEKQIESHFPPSLQGEAKALLLGLRDDVNQEQTRAYQILGITHLFAISGLHVAFLSFIFYQTLLRLSIRKEVATWCLIIGLPLYACLVGGAPSVWRAVSVVEILLLTRQLKLRIAIEDAFAISILILIFMQPGILWQIGFQLSYAAAATLIFSAPFLASQTTILKQSFWITFLCQIGVAPILLYHFYEISLSSFFVNLVFVPLFSFFILPINLVLFLLSFIWPALPEFIFIVYEPLRSLLTTCILKMASLPYQLWNPGKLEIWQMVIAYIGVFSTFLLLELEFPVRKLLCSLGLPILIIQLTPYTDSSLNVSFLNVGQGDATVIELPHKQGVLLIDAGGLLRFDQAYWKQTDSAFEIGREVIVPFLKGSGIQSIDTFIWTHADSDHIEGAEEILEEVNVREIHVTPGAKKEPTLQEAVQTARDHKVTMKEKRAGDSFQMGKTQMMYVSPQDTMYEGNDDSLVLYLKHREFTMLFTGDLEEEGEETLVQTYGGLGNITVLKAGHHGSNTSSTLEFLEKINPRITVISAGKNNRYGHPHPDVIERFQKLHLPILTTAEVGSVHIRFRGEEMTIRTTY